MLTTQESIAADEFMMAHYKKPCRKTNKRAAIILRISATGIGNAVKAECPHCGKTLDITDYESW